MKSLTHETPDKIALEDIFSECQIISERLSQDESIDESAKERLLAYLKQLTEFELGRFFIKNQGALSGHWTYFILRWNLEVTFFETRAHLGVETQRQWSDKAIQRTTPLLMGLYSVITLIGVEMNKARSLVVAETTSWYDKKGELTFIDILAVVRRSIWSKRFSKSANHHDLVKIIDQDMALILDQLAIAA